MIRNWLINADFYRYCQSALKSLRKLDSTLFKYLDTNHLLSNNWSGFFPVDSWVHQLLSIIHDVYKDFDTNSLLEVRGTFLDLAKAPDRVW